ncbi:hypothetical protein Tco_1421503, partial [Tanacetum coccineum]
GQSVRVTLLGGLGETLIEKRMRHVDSIDGITIVSPFANRLYLSSSSSTLIINDDNIPELKQLKTDDSGVESSKETLPVDFGEAKAETLENLLMWARNRKHDDGDAHSALPHALSNIVGTSHTLELKAHTYYEHDTYESFTCWRIRGKWVDLEDSDVEASFVAETRTRSGEAPSNKRRNTRRVVDDSSME